MIDLGTELSASSDIGAIFVCFVDSQRAERHLAVMPQFPGGEAFCGQRVVASQTRPWRIAMQAATCGACRRIAADFKPRPSWAGWLRP